MKSATSEFFAELQREYEGKKKRKKEKKERKEKKEKKEPKKKKRKLPETKTTKAIVSKPSLPPLPLPSLPSHALSSTKPTISFPHQYILAPMVGASELAFRMLCRKYGAQACYTPMMSARQFAVDPASEGFSTCAADRPLVCHVWANIPQDFAAAAQRAQAEGCDAIDLNLGCPQRTAYVGRFGSYIMEETDLICRMIAAAAPILPVCCKIRLFAKLEDTMALIHAMIQAGVSLVAIHGRYRASWERTGPGARDGPAHLDQIAEIRKRVGSRCLIVTNGNTTTWEDVQSNLEETKADGLMSAEGLLDNPALFLSRYGSDPRVRGRDKQVQIPSITEKSEESEQKIAKLQKKLKKIEDLESLPVGELDDSQKFKIASKQNIRDKLAKLQDTISTVTLSSLFEASQDKLQLAREYLDCVEKYPVKIRSVGFHTRRILKEDLVKFQLLEECINCTSVQAIRDILTRLADYKLHPETFEFDQEKARKEKDALARKKALEGRRKAFEQRMMRKAKREGKSDLTFYLRIGADVPSAKTLQQLKKLLQAGDKPRALSLWKEKNHAQHCFTFHLEKGGCPREATCAFLHVSTSSNDFEEKEEVAG